MATINISNTNEILTGNDGIVIKKFLEGKDGGFSLDTTGYAPETIPAGHPVIKETATGQFKPMPVTGTAPAYTLDALPNGHTLYGVMRATVLTKTPFAGIMVRGTVNPQAMVYKAANGTALTAIATALPLIRFEAD